MDSYLKFIASAWEDFTNKGYLNNKVRKEIRESWVRCKKFGVDPLSGRGNDTQKVSIELKNYENVQLISVAKPIMEGIYNIVAESGFAIILADKNGYIIEVMGDKDIMRRADELNFVKGALWIEEAVGTNAIGTALYLDKPIQTIGAEHYGINQHSWTCSAAPIHDEANNMIGCINMSGYYYNAHSHTLAIVTSAAQYIQKQLELTIAYKKVKQDSKVQKKKVGFEANYKFEDIITNNSEMKQMIKFAKKAAESDCNVLIEGQSGTGKELLAQSIHNYSKRSEYPFVAVNCASIPRELVESELFGYEKGAFTGASKEGHPGKFELADGGTIFLDEFGELPLDMQSKLLRVLDNNKINRIGGSHEKQLNVRVIAATNKDLKEEIKIKNFREDLYYRISVMNIKTVSLNDRKEDIELLVNHFVEKLNFKNTNNNKKVTKEYIKVLKESNWPGNVRQLRNVIERDYYLSDDYIFSTYDAKKTHIYNSYTEENYREENILTIQLLEKENIEKALIKCEGNIVKACRLLNLSRSTLYRKIKKYNINNKENKNESN